jgi:ParB family chromosome partitioning protein
MKPSSQKTHDMVTRERAELPVASILRDEKNRTIDEKGKKFVELVESVRAVGVLQPIHVQRTMDSSYRLVDGERRWRAARACGLETIPCEVWPADMDDVNARVAGLILNDPDKREQHTCVQIARGLREIKLARGLSNEQLAEQMRFSLDRVRTYMALFGASEFLFDFFGDEDVSLHVAAELMRFEKEAGEPAARRLVERFREQPMSLDEIALRRKRYAEKKGGAASKEAREEPTHRPSRLLVSLELTLRKDTSGAIASLVPILEQFGYRLVPAAAPSETPTASTARPSARRLPARQEGAAVPTEEET